MKKITSPFIIVLLFCQIQFGFAQKPNISVTKFRDSAESSAWCQYDSTLVAYNLMQANGYYGIYTANVGPANNLMNEHCFTCSNASLPGKNYAQPAFDPTGRYMLFMAEKAVHSGTSANSIPGIGAYNDLWVMTMNQKKAYRLTTTPDTGLSAMIEPYFSPTGKEILWAEMTAPVNAGIGKQEFGYWVIKIARFVDDTVKGPHLDSTTIKTIEPGSTQGFNEPYGWSPDGSKILFASDYNQFWVWDDQIYTMDTNGNNIQQMTSTAHSYPYTEHAFYSTDGKHIVWMTDLDNTVGSSKGGDDWWIMNSDTTKQERLTYFNDSLSPYWTGNIHINGHGSYSPDNKKFIGDVGGSQPVQVNPAASIGASYIIGINSLTGIENVSDQNPSITLYPNPAADKITIQLTGISGQALAEVYNMLGEKVYSTTLSHLSKGTLNKIDLSNLGNGIYLLKLGNESGSVSKKFVIQR